MANIGDAIQAINNRFEANGNVPFTVAVDEHGAPATARMGGGMGAANCGNANLDLSNSMDNGPCLFERIHFGRACNGRVTQVSFYGCEVAQGEEGEKFLQGLANTGAMRVGGFTKKTYVIDLLVGCAYCAGIGNVFVVKRPQ